MPAVTRTLLMLAGGDDQCVPPDPQKDLTMPGKRPAAAPATPLRTMADRPITRPVTLFLPVQQIAALNRFCNRTDRHKSEVLRAILTPSLALMAGDQDPYGAVSGLTPDS